MNNVPDLMAMAVLLRAKESGTLPATNGRLVHSAFFGLLNQFSTGLATKLHQNSGAETQPFTLSSLRGGKRKEPEKAASKLYRSPVIPIDKGVPYWLRITSLERDFSGVLLSIFQALPQGLKIGGIDFEFIGIDRAHPDRSAAETYANLAEQFLGNEETHSLSFGFKFISATAIHSNDRNLLFPLPSLIFPQLLEKWNRFSPQKINLPSLIFPQFLEKWNSFSPPKKNYMIGDAFDRNLMICGYHLHTHNLNFGSKGQQIGFTGYCEYCPSKTALKEILTIIHLLGTYAFFAGIGYRTTWGMGQTQFVIP